jgi:hypothetical protein
MVLWKQECSADLSRRVLERSYKLSKKRFVIFLAISSIPCIGLAIFLIYNGVNFKGFLEEANAPGSMLIPQSIYLIVMLAAFPFLLLELCFGNSLAKPFLFKKLLKSGEVVSYETDGKKVGIMYGKKVMHVCYLRTIDCISITDDTVEIAAGVFISSAFILEGIQNIDELLNSLRRNVTEFCIIVDSRI